ncbi:MAG: glycosyltransferase family 4 protein [Chloroflexi bacterium]|nr:glycosyltransferase family 4 protein [Chloroflexota bacterium]
MSASSRLRVSIVNYTLSMMRGGGETRDLAFATHLDALGCDVTLVSVDPLLGKVRHPIAGVPARYLRAPYFRDLVYRLMVLPKTGRLATFLLNQDFKRFSKAVVNLVADPAYPIDILQAAGLYPVVEVKRRRPLPVIIRNQGGLPAKWLRPYVPKADAIIGDGWDALNFEQALGRELVEITGGVDSELFRPVEPDEELRSQLAGRPILLYVGRFVPLKNLPMLIDTFAEVRTARPDAALVMVGEGALEGQVREQVARLGLSDGVTFLGHQPQFRLPALYAASDVVLLSSIFDNSPNCVLEANACERPVVATRVGGVPRYVTEGENGLLADSNDASGFAQAILALLSNPGRARAMGLNGRQRVLERHSWRKSAEKLIGLYERLLAAGPRPLQRRP